MAKIVNSSDTDNSLWNQPESAGMLITVASTAANPDDGRAAQEVFAQARGRDFPRLGVVSADSRYHNYELYDWLRIHRRPYRVEVVSRPEGQKGFVSLRVRWVVERTFAWLGRYSCLSKDYEHTPLSSETVVKIAAITCSAACGPTSIRRLVPRRQRPQGGLAITFTPVGAAELPRVAGWLTI